MTHQFPPLPISLHRKAVQETCSLCGSTSWRYKDGTRWVEREECDGPDKIRKTDNDLNENHMTNFLDDLVYREMVGWYLHELHQIGTAIGENWDFWAYDSFEMTVTKQYAEVIYGCCKEIMAVSDNGLSPKQMKIIRKARLEAHQFLFDEANDANTSIERKIALVKLTSKNA